MLLKAGYSLTLDGTSQFNVNQSDGSPCSLLATLSSLPPSPLPAAAVIAAAAAVVRELHAQFPHCGRRLRIGNLFNDDCGGNGAHYGEEAAMPQRKYKVECGRRSLRAQNGS